MTLSEQSGVSAGESSVFQTVERCPKDEGSFTDPNGPGGRSMRSNSFEIAGILEGDGSNEHRRKNDNPGGEGVEHCGKGDGNSGNGDEAGNSERDVAETKDTQTEEDIDLVVGRANAPQFFVQARPWATQLEHGFVPDDSAGESRVVRVRLRQRAFEEG